VIRWLWAVKFARQQHGLTLDGNDLWVAATALALGATLVSRDGFQRGCLTLATEFRNATEL
jgi:predicted nucleic acid-binding protein